MKCYAIPELSSLSRQALALSQLDTRYGHPHHVHEPRLQCRWKL